MAGESQDRRLPNGEHAYVEAEKLTGYLLNVDHPIGGDKAAFFSRFGFSHDTWRLLESALLSHAIEGHVVAERQTAYGSSLHG